jgi:hypothetical protein
MEKQFNQCCADRSVRLNTSTGAVDCVNCGAVDKYAGRAHCPCCGWRRLRRNVDGGAVECAKCGATWEMGGLDGTVYEYSQAEHDALAAVLDAQMTDCLESGQDVNTCMSGEG